MKKINYNYKSCKKYILLILLYLMTNISFGQIKNIKTDTVTIYGNCGMCKSNIEEVGNKKNVSTMVWDIESKLAIVSYDSTKTNIKEILKKVSDSGYDNEYFFADDNKYSKLHFCCQYDRREKTDQTDTISK